MKEFRLKKIDIYLFYFIIIDVLFLPYNPIIATSNGQFVLLLWFLFRKGYSQMLDQKEIKIFKLFSFMVVFGTIFSLFIINYENFSEGVLENMKRGFQLILGIFYYFFFYIFFKSYSFSDRVVKRILFSFIFYVFLWGILYFIDFDLFLTIKKVFNRYDSFVGFFENNDNFYRFSFIWSDPNNIAYAVMSCFAFYLIYFKSNLITVLFLTGIIMFIAIIAQSSGGWVSFFTVCLLLLIKFFINDIRFNLKISNILLYIIMVPVVIYYISSSLNMILSDDIVVQSLDRASTNTSDGRFVIWERLLESKLDYIYIYMFFGTGYQIYVNEMPFNAHNGHLLLLFAYGLTGYLSYFLLFFKKAKYVTWNSYLFVVPFLICFTINTMIGELKLVVLFYFLVSYMKVEAMKKANV